MRTGRYNPAATLFFASSSTIVAASVLVSRGVDVARSSHLLPAARSDAAPLSPQQQLAARTLPPPLTNKAYLPAQIGGLVGSYALCLVVIALTLLLLSKRRREHIESADELEFFQHAAPSRPLPETFQLQDSVVPYAVKSPAQNNFSYPSALSPTRTSNPWGSIAGSSKHNPYIAPSVASSSFRVPGVDPSVDQEIVSADREMAQSQLEEMYKYVMEQEEAKANGAMLPEPPAQLSPISNTSRSQFGGGAASNNADLNKHRKDASSSSTSILLRKEKNKPMSLNLSLGSKDGKDERSSRTSSILSALKSPRKKKMQGMSISSPIMTPMSSSFPHANGLDGEEMNTIPPRYYMPAAPPPVPTDQAGWAAQQMQQQRQQAQQQPLIPHIPPMPKQHPQHQQPVPGAPITPDMSPLSTLSIDERIGASIITTGLDNGSNNRHNRNPSVAEPDPDSAVSADSSAPLVGLPSSPKPYVTRFPPLSSLPSSPRSTTSFSRPNAPSAVRTGGALPLRAYEPALTSPSYASTKQTVFERSMPLSPSGAHTPWTGAPVPYSPYQPFSPVVPITPSLVTKADRKRMKRLEPKTPTMEMVRSIEDTW